MRSAGLAGTSGRCAAAVHVIPHLRPLLQVRPSLRQRSAVETRQLFFTSRRVCCAALSHGAGDVVYKGVYGDWRVEDSDVREVQGYRAGLTVAAAALLLDTVLALSDGKLAGGPGSLKALQDGIAVVGAAGFGASLFLIHIYVTPLKRFIQLLWGVGFLSGVALMATQPEPITEYVGSHPAAVWAVGPLFAAFTGVAFKEGVCYGKPECAVLFFLTPSLLLGHLSGLLPEAAEHALLLAFTATCLVFAGRKYTQAIKDDIGDKSVFMFQAMSEEEQQKLVAGMQQAEWMEER